MSIYICSRAAVHHGFLKCNPKLTNVVDKDKFQTQWRDITKSMTDDLLAQLMIYINTEVLTKENSMKRSRLYAFENLGNAMEIKKDIDEFINEEKTKCSLEIENFTKFIRESSSRNNRNGNRRGRGVSRNFTRGRGRYYRPY